MVKRWNKDGDSKMSGEELGDIDVHVGIMRRVRIEKLLGPLTMLDIRISIDYYTVSWVIERLGIDDVWTEVARIDGNPEPGDHT